MLYMIQNVGHCCPTYGLYAKIYYPAECNVRDKKE